MDTGGAAGLIAAAPASQPASQPACLHACTQALRKAMRGLTGLVPFRITPDGKSYAYTYNRSLSNLFIADGVK